MTTATKLDRRERCERCACWVFIRTEASAGGEERRGECRRYAPAPQLDGRRARWPQTLASEWCGEFTRAARRLP
jgi:hypothetical protein